MTRRPIGRHGSLVVMALVFLTVLGIIILVYHWSSVSTHKMFHHTYYSEKSIALIDGLAAIARGVVQEKLEEIVDELEEGKSMLITDELKQKAKDLKLIDPDDAEAKRQIEPHIEASVRMLRKQDFKDKYKTVKSDDKEKVGKLEIVIDVQFKGFLTSFESGKKVAKLQYEWKKLRGIPQFFRHFSLFVKNGIPQDEREDDYQGQSSNFNHLVNTRQGTAAGGGAIFVQSSGSGGLPADKLPRAKADKKDNPFYSQIGYVYLGGGQNKAYLNLSAGGGGGKAENTEKSPYGEDFHLYRGENTDFYRVVSTEFSNFIEQMGADEQARPEAKGFLKRLKEIIKTTVKGISDFFKKSFSLFKAIDKLEGSNEDAHSANLPLYYVVRKDYGYAQEWGTDAKYKKFGFGGGNVVSSSLHLYNHNWQNAEPSPTVVLGNVYRRCLSLSGYKQRRAADNPTTNKQFEVQAGPVEYFKDMGELVKRTADWTKPEENGGPVWVWDARVDWSFIEDGKKRETDGIYVPISGPALFGRLVPGLARFHEEDKTTAQKLFNAAIAPPDKMTSDKDSSMSLNASDVEDDVRVSPLFVIYREKDGFEDLGSIGNQIQAVRNGVLFGEMGKGKNSPYFEEMLRNFLFSSFHMPNEEREMLTGAAKATVNDAAGLWEGILTAYKEGPAILKGKVKPLDTNAIADERKKRDWIGTKPLLGIFPWSFPDPWSKSSDNFMDALKGADEKKLFEQYFKPMMTNPGRVLPYNYSMRFWFTELKEIFSMNPKDRLAILGKEIIPEVRDAAFGYLTTANNDYMKAKQGETTDPPLNDETLSQIHKLRKSDKTLQNGYFFMDDYATSVDQPAKVDLADIFPGDHYSYEEMTQQQFDDRFVKTKAAGADGKVKIELGTVVKVKDFALPACEIRGGGGILCEGTLKINGNVESMGPVPLILKAAEYELGPTVEKIQAIVVATKEFKWKGARECEIFGTLIAEAWDPYSWVSQSQSMKKLKFNPGLKHDPETTPYIHNLEPRMRKFVVEGAQ